MAEADWIRALVMAGPWGRGLAGASDNARCVASAGLPIRVDRGKVEANPRPSSRQSLLAALARSLASSKR